MKTIKLLAALLLVCKSAHAQQTNTMQDRLPALKALASISGDLQHGKITGDLELQKGVAYLVGAIQGAYSTIALWEMASPGSFKLPAVPDHTEMIRNVYRVALLHPEMLDMTPSDFVLASLYISYGTKPLPVRP